VKRDRSGGDTPGFNPNHHAGSAMRTQSAGVDHG
jgi:hypothetical protein